MLTNNLMKHRTLPYSNLMQVLMPNTEDPRRIIPRIDRCAKAKYAAASSPLSPSPPPLETTDDPLGECQDGGRDPTWAMTRRPKLEKPRQPTQPAAALPIATFHGR